MAKRRDAGAVRLQTRESTEVILGLIPALVSALAEKASKGLIGGGSLLNEQVVPKVVDDRTNTIGAQDSGYSREVKS